MDIDRTSLLWDEHTAYKLSPEDFQTYGSLVHRTHPDAQDLGLIQNYSAFEYASEEDLIFTTDSPSSLTALRPVLPHDDHSPQSAASYQEWLDVDLQLHDDSGYIERTSFPKSDASILRSQSCELSSPRSPPPSPLVSDGVTTSTFPEVYESKEFWKGLYHSSEIGVGVKSELTASRKRGRPRKDAIPSVCPARPCNPRSDNRSARVPHHEVERKYREGLNAALERLRRAVPTLPQGCQDGAIGAPRPSKSMIIAGALEYIKRLEKDKAIVLKDYETLEQRRLYKSGE